jgi:hypothetical protein
VMQATKSWHGYDWATYIRVFLWFATRRCPLCEREMCSVVVVQPGYETPIKLAFAKCSTAGTHGMDSVYSFEAMRDAVAVGCCAACRTM